MLKFIARLVPLVVGALFLSACAKMPSGPSIAVMPGPGKPFEVFVQEEQLCRSWAAQSVGVSGPDAPRDAIVGSAVTGAAIGAIAGAVAGGNRNVHAGAAMGTVIGATAGANQDVATTWEAQRRYDIAYQQCMYAKGNSVLANDGRSYRHQSVPPPPPPPPSQLAPAPKP